MFAAGDVCALREEKTAERAMAHADLIVEHLKNLAKGRPLSNKYKSPSKPPLQVINLSDKRALAIFDGEVRDVTGSAATKLQSTINNAILKRIKSASQLRGKKTMAKSTGLVRSSSSASSSSSTALNVQKVIFEGKILVLGADNAVARAVLKRLAVSLDSNQVRVALKQYGTNKVTRRLCDNLGVEVVEVNEDSPHTLALAVKGIRVVYIANDLSSATVALVKKLCASLEGKTSVRRVVLSSEGALHAEEDKSTIGEWTLECEDLLVKHGVNCVSVRSSLSCAFLAGWQARSVRLSRALRLPFPETLRISWIHPTDIAKASIKAILDQSADESQKKLTKTVVELTGPTAVTGHEISTMLSSAVGETVYYVCVAEKGEKAFWESDVGSPAEVATALQSLASVVRCGSQAITSNNFAAMFPDERMLSLEDFVKENVHDFL
jgi:uncharacterized protein YbjT (DUF2867 family)